LFKALEISGVRSSLPILESCLSIILSNKSCLVSFDKIPSKAAYSLMFLLKNFQLLPIQF